MQRAARNRLICSGLLHTQKELHREFQMDMTPALFVVNNAVEFAYGSSPIMHSKIMRNQFSLWILLQEKMPELLKVNTQSMGRAHRQVLQKRSGVLIQLLQPPLPVMRKLWYVGRYGALCTRQLANMH